MSEETTQKNRHMLCVVDGSYFCHYVLNSALSQFKKRYTDEYSIWVKPPDQVDQHNIPNLLNCEIYRKLLKNATMAKLQNIENVVKDNYTDEIEEADRLDVIFALDDDIRHSFRKQLYPEYKAQRQTIPLSFQRGVIKDYIINVIFKDLEVESKYNYKLLKVEGAEGDDVIACIMKITSDYMTRILIASDKDFLQIPNIKQYNLYGGEVVRDVGTTYLLTAEDFILHKLIIGDHSDNISNVFHGIGPIKALKLIEDKDALKTMLKENQDAAKQFLLNKKLMCFSEIPKDLSQRIIDVASNKLSEFNNVGKLENFDFMEL